MAPLVEKHVLRLQVAVDDTANMQLLQRQDQLGDVILGHILNEVAEFFKQLSEVTALHVFHDHEEILPILEGVQAASDEARLQVLQNRLLVHNGVNAVLLLHLVYLEHFYRIVVLSVLFSGQQDLAKRTGGERLDVDEIANRDLRRHIAIVDRARLSL